MGNILFLLEEEPPTESQKRFEIAKRRFAKHRPKGAFQFRKGYHLLKQHHMIHQSHIKFLPRRKSKVFTHNPKHTIFN